MLRKEHTNHSDQTDTREKILVAAAELFAEKGYRATTIALICEKAQANIAAVNYYFRSKENLYQAAWQYAHRKLMTKIPPDGGVSDDAPPEARLRGRIKAGLQKAMLPNAAAISIMHKEMATPTGLLQQVIHDAIKPVRTATQAILQELLGPSATSLDVELCEICVVSPCMHIAHHQQTVAHGCPGPAFKPEMLNDMVEHFTGYALAGIREIRRRIEERAN